ncbi:S-adenosyl-L-methionine dependent methyltransferase [Thelephora ganbajun]|uniref:S-adenosyl-L-methionine dependent methyltransferase n=1 Tax=Thelephora ganbajun TaxID=370292 RepID=A0ACB6ZTE7_THEGA|nr:S-adenosyl-L-methionine dependent methyltransferase [Thelephora ganbajun]
MHPRNPYNQPPDFLALAKSHPSLLPHIIQTANGPTINFKSETALRHLTQALLQKDFSLNVQLPIDRLCPPVPNRLNYILWIQDVLDPFHSAPVVPVKAIDIGTGASCIYPLLGCRISSSWNFIATETDPSSYECASINITSNGLQSRIQLHKAQAHEPILSPLLGPGVFDFAMCNPPFYSNREEIEKKTAEKEFSPSAVCTGADTEMITPGGESAFVRQIVAESLIYRTRCRWFTSMLGKLSSLTDVVNSLRENGVENYAITEFVQGQTRRWAIGWSFGDDRLPDSVSRISNQSLHSLMPPHNTIRQPLSPADGIVVLQKLKQVLSTTEGVAVTQEHTTPDEVTIRLTTTGNTWSRAARRKKLKAPSGEMPQETSLSPAAPFNWVRGRDRALFESFCSHISRKVASDSSS